MSIGSPQQFSLETISDSCVNVDTPREFIKAGWYVDTENRRMRLDSYGVPKGLNMSTAQVLQYYISEYESFEYACEDYGPPLYIFIYLYDQGRMLTLFPSPNPPYRQCTISTIFNKFPSSPLSTEVEFVEESHDNITTFNHWRSEFFLYTLDYYFHAANGLPYKLIVNEEENLFISFIEEALSPSTFAPPQHVVCK
ncbi:uncharacterized protein LOC128239292 isoform X2 [Mya arenaria]|uniref:uncharacterized protein LOC128239292 isoform X2 n=1 Tax=Mya arenaria TaxID=6604 RepID=UPI0022E52762|nr:uncharacterized protein LOC128239292 isoform X2 [Mya arenaria]